MADDPKVHDPQSQRPQERDLRVDQWDKYPFRRKDDPFENRSEQRKDDDDQSQYEYEGWEHQAFPNKNVSEKPAESSDTSKSIPCDVTDKDD
jgi:hypothetical protein